MAASHSDEGKRAVNACVERLRGDQLAPWKVEEELESAYGIRPPENFELAALCRQGFLEERTAEKFCHIRIPDKPFKGRFLCPRDNLVWELDMRDEDRTSSLC